MCKCRPEVKTPFCGRFGCEWPHLEKSKKTEIQYFELYTNKWLSLMEVKAPTRGITGYIYSHETRCKGEIVALLPYRIVSNGVYEYLLKNEMTPCWSFDKTLSAITGGWEGGDIRADAVKELLEETGYEIQKTDLINLGASHASKSSDTVYSLFSVNLTGKTAGVPQGDGSRIESESEAVWVKPNKLLEILDPQVSVMYLRLKKYLVARNR